MSAAPVSIAVFEFLDATHQEIQRELQLLHTLVDAIENDGLNTANRASARPKPFPCPLCVSHPVSEKAAIRVAPRSRSAASW